MINPPPQSPLTRVIGGILAVITLIGAFMIGMVALLVVAGVGLFAGIAIWFRVAWIKRQMRKNGFDATSGAAVNKAASNHAVIDAEYTVVSKQEE